ncbi:hypothetical protein APHAL10511_002833 [Amanita phalloides]|nr:hypothetical protein APHAL10511_002833 [Amanita phalloides]
MPYYTVPPRPILKRAANTSPTPSPNSSHHVVHFPPSPSLTRIFSAHSSATYDRSPIVIAPNACTLPERGCPGRTYYSGEDSRPRCAKAIHPRSLPGLSRSSDIPPPLVPDLSSESDESDGFASPFPEPSLQSSHVYNDKGLAYYPVDVALDTATALSFLPYPPSPLNRQYEEASSPPSISRHRRPSRERKHDSSRDLGRIRSDDGCSESQHHRGRRGKGSSKTRSSDRALSICSSFSSFGVEDDGCLGGF